MAARYSVRINGLDGIALTLLDVLDTFDKVRVCTAYEYEGKRYNDFPAAPWILEEATPIYEDIDGWEEEIYGTSDWDLLPAKAKAYVARLEEILDCPVAILSTGPDREHTIIRDPSLKKLLNR